MSGFWLKMGVYLALVGLGYYFFLFFNAKHRPNYNRNRRIVFTVVSFPFLGVLVALIINAVIPLYYLEPYKGKVVEADTGQPIEGVAVLVIYRVDKFSIHGSNPTSIDAQETVTNQEGEYRIPGQWKEDSNKTPYGEINIFKPGYTYDRKVYDHFLSGKPRYWNAVYEVFELERLYSKEDRRENYRSGCSVGSSHIPDIKMKSYNAVCDQERMFIFGTLE